MEGEALVIWLELTPKKPKNYSVAKKEIQSLIMPMGFVSLDKFYHRKLRPGKPIPVFVYDLKKLLEIVIPGMSEEAKDSLSLCSLPELITK